MKLTKIALGVALAAGTVAAQAADTLWFPHVVNSGTVTTVLTVIDTAGTDYTGVAKPHHMHYVYKAKDKADSVEAFNLLPCEENDTEYPFSTYDVQTFDLSGVLSSNKAGVLFEEAAGPLNNDWTRFDYMRAAIAADSARKKGINVEGTRGYFVVEDATAAADGDLQGYAMIFDYQSGSAWGYPGEAFNAPVYDHTPQQFAVHLMPPAETITRLMVTPFGTAADMVPSGIGWQNAQATTVTPVALSGSLAVADRDENLDSGTYASTVVCVGTVDVLNGISNQKVVENGGWMKMTTAAPAAPYNAAPYTALANAVVYQLDFGGKGATNNQFNGVSYPGTWNNVTIRQ